MFLFHYDFILIEYVQSKHEASFYRSNLAELLFFPLSHACLLQSLVGVAGGATRAALTVHQARRDNMADISAKDGSQVPHLDQP